ncbi:hypothetical protein [Photobacterium damselae]|uniref:hypothetical protein n=1 Tax=Photobacterium damselae TaxID=38293 RepID=UPI0010768735|nr:hypothetical protein [Photobacterium damselae]
MGYYDDEQRKYIEYFQGEQWKVDNIYSGCEVLVPKEIFEKKFSICMLTGIEIKTQGGCTLFKRGSNYIFSFDDYLGVSCFCSCEMI